MLFRWILSISLICSLIPLAACQRITPPPQKPINGSVAVVSNLGDKITITHGLNNQTQLLSGLNLDEYVMSSTSALIINKNFWLVENRKIAEKKQLKQLLGDIHTDYIIVLKGSFNLTCEPNGQASPVEYRVKADLIDGRNFKILAKKSGLLKDSSGQGKTYCQTFKTISPLKRDELMRWLQAGVPQVAAKNSEQLLSIAEHHQS